MIVVAVLALLRSTDAIALGKANVADVLAAVKSKIISKINGVGRRGAPSSDFPL
jgi:hypothetical protein